METELIEMERRHGNKDREVKSPVRVRTHRRRQRRQDADHTAAHARMHMCTDSHLSAPSCSYHVYIQTCVHRSSHIRDPSQFTRAYTHTHTRERACIHGNCNLGTQPGTEDQRHREPEEQEKRDGEREREKRDKDESESWSQTESREGSEGERQPEPGSNYGRAGRSRGQPV